MPDVLAIDRGTPVRSLPMPVWPVFGEAEMEATRAVLERGKVNYWGGSEGPAFEAEYAAEMGRDHAIAVANGTLALELALKAFGIGAGDEVVVPARTFMATASSVVAVGAVPVIADIDPDSNNMTAGTVGEVITERTRAIIPVHLGGWPVDLDPIMRLAGERDIVVIEDCAQAHGALYHGRPIGSTGQAAGLSFCQDKVLPVGEGGMLLLDDDAAFERAWAYKDHGKSYRKVHGPAPQANTFRWLIDSFGTNWRLGELYSALGRTGLRQLPDWHAARTRNALRLASGLDGAPGIVVPLPGEGFEHAYYRLYAHVDASALAPGWTRDRIIAAIVAEGVPVQYGTCAEIYREDAFAAAGLGPATRLPGARRADETSLSFFVHPTLGDSDIDDTIAAVRKVMEVAAE